MNSDQNQKAEELAKRIIQVSQNTLLLSLRFMDVAIFRLTPKQEETTLATDGRLLYYGVNYVLKQYRNEPAQMSRDVLHVILHCVFRHFFVNPAIDVPIWDLAVDIAVENMINELGINCSLTKRVRDQLGVLQELRNNLKTMNAEHIYRYYKDRGITEETAEDLRLLFQSDDHSNWYEGFQVQVSISQRRSGSGPESDSESDSESEAESGGASALGQVDQDQAGQGQADDALREEWESVSKQIQMDLEAFGKQRGIDAGSMIQQLRELNRERYDYTAFLKKFAVLGEAMKINDDEFDYIFYTYGLKLYGNVPLIEPLEYKEVKRIREFVIAIDTSGSTSGDLVQRFLQKTYNILKSTESFFSKINLHIIQCDAQIQEHVKITTQEEFDRYLETMEIHGLGGTDFRPVFEEVDRLLVEKEFEHLKGMIYFTDGYGVFPAKKPPYETAFVFIRNDYGIPEVPPWAIKLILDAEEI